MEEQNISDNRGVLTFITLTFFLSSIFYFLIISAGSLQAGNGLYTLGLMWSPGIAALISLKILGRSLRDIGWKWGKTKYQAQAYLIPLFYSSIAYLLIWTFAWGRFYDTTFVAEVAQSLGLGGKSDLVVILLYILIEASVAVLVGAIFALGEEIGWRGFLLPELYKRYGFTKSSLITGFIWGLWHLPVLIFADYKSEAPLWISMLCFMTLVISASFIYTWYRIRSGSLWTAVLLHACHNVFIQSIFTPLTEDTGKTAYFVDEFGIVVPIVVLGFAIYFWNKRNELITPSQEIKG